MTVVTCDGKIVVDGVVVGTIHEYVESPRKYVIGRGE